MWDVMELIPTTNYLRSSPSSTYMLEKPSSSLKLVHILATMYLKYPLSTYYLNTQNNVGGKTRHMEKVISKIDARLILCNLLHFLQVASSTITYPIPSSQDTKRHTIKTYDT